MKELKHMEDLNTHEMIKLKQILKRCEEVCVCACVRVCVCVRARARVCVCVDYINLAQYGKKLQFLVKSLASI
jgi:hypothetical protein